MQNLILRQSALQKAFCAFSSNSTRFNYERAPEPSDICWENLSTTSLNRFIRVCLTFIATFLMIGACFGIIWGLNVANKEAAKNGNENSGSVKFLSFVCSFVIIAINIMLLSVIRYLSIKEKHETYTGYNLSVAFKLTVVRFVNTAIVPTVVNALSDRWFCNGGLVSVYFSIMISMSLTTPLTYLFDVGVIVSHLKRWYYKR